jgi:hypothetical protein
MRTSAALLVLGLSLAASRPAAATRPENTCQLLPVVLDVEAAGTRYRTEVTFSNPSKEDQNMVVLYTASLGAVTGSGEGRFTIPGGEQVFTPDGIEFLRKAGIAIQASSPETPQAGTLRICSLNPGQLPVGVLARITSPTRPPVTAGNAGVSFTAVPADEGFTGRALVFGLRRSSRERSNVALYNPGVDPVSVSVTLVSGTTEARSVVSAREDLPAYGWRQFPAIAAGTAAFDEGYVVVERVSPQGFFGAYGVVNDNETNDGSFIPAIADGAETRSWVLPVLVDSTAYRSELIVANAGDVDATFVLEFTDSLGLTSRPRSATLPVPARRQAIVPDVFELLGGGMTAGGGATVAGTLRVRVVEEGVRGAFASVRVLTRGEGGRFGVFAPSVPPGSSGADQAFLWGLRADEGTRSNVAVLNANEATGESVTLQLQVFDGVNGGPAGAPLNVTLDPGKWAQPPGFFADAGVKSGDVRIVRVGGTGPWFAYAVVNDGAAPGEGTGDGSFVPAVFAGTPSRLPAGAWGAPGVKVVVGDAGAVAIETDCALGSIVGPVYVDANGRFNGDGTWALEGGPVPVGGFPAQKVLFSGQAEGEDLVLTVRFVHSPTSQDVRLTAKRGAPAPLNKCL